MNSIVNISDENIGSQLGPDENRGTITPVINLEQYVDLSTGSHASQQQQQTFDNHIDHHLKQVEDPVGAEFRTHV